jgi:hypothetical protein
MIEEGTAYLSLRSVARVLKLDVRYDADNQMIFIKTPGPAVPKAKPPPVQ